MNKFTMVLQRLGDWIDAAPDAGLFFAEADLTPPIKTAPQPLVELMLATRGDIQFTVYGGDGVRAVSQTIGEGEVALVSAHHGNFGPLLDPRQRYACISFIVPPTLRALADGRHPLLVRQRATDPASMMPALREVAQFHRAPPRSMPRLQIKAALLRLIAATYAECSGDDDTSAGDDCMRRVQRLVCDRLADPDLALEHLASEARLSVNQLIRRFRAEFGQSPISYVLHLRVERARDLLRRTTLSIKEVARLAGFRDQGYFTRQFTRRAKTSPTLFRSLPLVRGGCGEFSPPDA